MLLRQYLHYFKKEVRRIASKPNINFIKLDPKVENDIDKEIYKPKKHPGVMTVKNVSLPAEIVNSIKCLLEDTSPKAVLHDIDNLQNYLWSRLPPPEEQDITSKAFNIHENILKRERTSQNLNDDENAKLIKQREVKVFNILKRNVYRWANISYDHNTCLQYLLLRSPAEYAVLYRIFSEIAQGMPNYSPRTFFDFGAGVGTGTWAARQIWDKKIFEYFTVDTSQSMNDMSRLLLCGGRENAELPIRAFFQRQFLPASSDISYDIVLSAYSLFELSSRKNRLDVIQTLWDKTNDFLVIVEVGTNAGFKLVNEAREYILDQNRKSARGYVFSPCQTDNVCPRYLEHETPCNFIVKYNTLPFGAKVDVRTELFSYVVLRKGDRPENEPKWPRIVRAPLVRSKHTICRLCTSQGKLQEVVFTKSKHGIKAYHCARSSSWGDLLPIELTNINKDENISEVFSTKEKKYEDC